MVSARAVARIFVPMTLVIGLLFSGAAPVGASAAPNQFAPIYQLAKTKVGDPWIHYAKGPNKFDCVGFVWYVYAQNGLKDRIGGYRGVKSYYSWFKKRGKVSKTNPKPGDLIIWGNFQHIGMYVGTNRKGKPMAISALVNPWGVKIHPVKSWIDEPFRYYLHVSIAR